MQLSSIIKKLVYIYYTYLKPIFAEVAKGKAAEPVNESTTDTAFSREDLSERWKEIQRSDQRAKKALNPLATKLITYLKTISNYEGAVPEGFSFIPDLEKIYDSINANLTGNAMKRVLTLLGGKGLDQAIGYNEWVLEKLKGDDTFPFADFQVLTDILERQQSILSTLKSSEERIKTQYTRQAAEMEAILGKSFKRRSTDI